MKESRFGKALQRRWYSERPHALLRPLAGLYGGIVGARRRAYQRGWLTSYAVDAPVVIVGNLSVGGSGKTPLVLALIERARRLGYKPGVVSRGYGGQGGAYPLRVDRNTAASTAGDEPVLIARRTGVPVVVDPDRVRAARHLLADADVSLVIADDGLQHYRLERCAEIVVVDARRGYGNGWLLPAGPLRERQARADEADLICVHGTGRDFWLEPGAACNLKTGERRALAAFTQVHALAGIGEPTRFFDMLHAAGLAVTPHPVADHHRYTEADLHFADDLPALMTEKDAVKCAAFGRDNVWAVPVETVLSKTCAARIDDLLEKISNGMAEGAQ